MLWESLRRFIDRPFYSLLLLLLAAVDIFVGFIPTDGLLLSSSAMRPKRWINLALATTIGNVIGAAILAGILIHDADWITQQWPSFFESDAWLKADKFLEAYGLWALWLVAATPLPVLPVIVGLSMAELSFQTLVLVFASSRLVKFGTLSWIASHSPKLLKKMDAWKN